MRRILMGCIGLAVVLGTFPAFADVKPSPEPSERSAWAQQPGSEDLARHYPAFALFFGVEGRVVLECVIQDDGRLSRCVVQSEDPAGWGFGAAASQLTPYFRAHEHLSGRRARVPVRFQVEG